MKVLTRKEVFMSGNKSNLTPMTREEAIINGDEVKSFTKDEALRQVRSGYLRSKDFGDVEFNDGNDVIIPVQPDPGLGNVTV